MCNKICGIVSCLLFFGLIGCGLIIVSFTVFQLGMNKINKQECTILNVSIQYKEDKSRLFFKVYLNETNDYGFAIIDVLSWKKMNQNEIDNQLKQYPIGTIQNCYSINKLKDYDFKDELDKNDYVFNNSLIELRRNFLILLICGCVILGIVLLLPLLWRIIKCVT